MQGVFDSLVELWSDLWTYINENPLGVSLGGSFLAAVL